MLEQLFSNFSNKSSLFQKQRFEQDTRSLLLLHHVAIRIAILQGDSRCLKITEKVTFNIASEASYVYSLSGQKFIKNAKNGPF